MFLSLPFRAEAPLKLWALFLILFPFYFFSSGLPQISDWVMVLLIVQRATWKAGLIPKDKFFRFATAPLFFLIVYSFLVTLGWLPTLYDPKYSILQFLYPVFFLYNGLTVLVAISLYKQYSAMFLKVTLVGLVLSFLIQVGLSPISNAGSFRGSLYFNNPNQLGYYILLSLTVFLYLETRVKSPGWLKPVMFVSALYLAGIALSKSSILSVGILLVISLIEAGSVSFQQIIGIVFALAVSTVLLFNTEFGSGTVDRVSTRFGQSNDDTLEARGYDRIWKKPEYLILGASEGGYNRFYTDPRKFYEMHSSFGTLLFSYGLPGFIAFFMFVFRSFRKSKVVNMLYAVPLFAYGVTHMGLRFTLFWIFFAMVIITNYHSIKLAFLRKKHVMNLKAKRVRKRKLTSE